MLVSRACHILTLLSMVLLSIGGSAIGQEDNNFLPGAAFDADIPTLESVVGHQPGERITSPDMALVYLVALQRARPEQVKIVPYATSWEGRQLVYMVISSAENLARLDDIQSNMQLLADPRKLGAAAAPSLIAEQPGITWLSYGVHGNEISSTDAALYTAYYLLAARNDKTVEKILAQTVVIIDPLQNPDGRARFVHGFEASEGLAVDPERLSAEHDEPWPNGRTNHYLFDMNRDWFALTQPETRGRVKAILDWFPLALVDAHEMNGDSSYYFAPPARPINPNLTSMQVLNFDLFGKNNARWFDRFGIDYYTREVFDAFYPGYGDSWPMHHGAIAMTYEQASPRGLAFRKYDGTVLTYREAVRNHFIASLATAEVVADHREKLLGDFYDYRRTAVEGGRKDRNRYYVLSAEGNKAGADKLAGNLIFQGVEVSRAKKDIKVCGKSYPIGSYVVDAAQPAYRLVKSLLDPDTPLSKEFMKEQERRRAKDLPHELYDVTSWSVPLMSGVELKRCHKVPTGEIWEQATEVLIREGRFEGVNARTAYLVRWQDAASVRLLAGALREGLAVRTADRGFVYKGEAFPRGTLIFPVQKNKFDLERKLAQLAGSSGASVIGVNSSWVDGGINFGSDNVRPIPVPRIAIAWDDGTSPYSAGNTRFVIERQFGYPVTAIRTSRMARADLSRFDVIIMPEEGWGARYAGELGKSGAKNLGTWVEEGGVLIGLGSALRFLSNPENKLMSLRREHAVRDGEKADGEDEEKAIISGSVISDEVAFEKRVLPSQELPDRMPGVLLNAQVDQDHWITAGFGSQVTVLASGSDIYSPLRRDQGVNAIRFAGSEELLASGYIWAENAKQLAFKPFLVVEEKGRGMMIGFTQSPTTRAMLDGLNMPFMNAVFLGPAHTGKLR